MIPGIALMIGTYIVARMIETIVKEKSYVIVVPAILTIGVVLYTVGSIMNAGLEVSRIMTSITPKLPSTERTIREIRQDPGDATVEEARKYLDAIGVPR